MRMKPKNLTKIYKSRVNKKKIFMLPKDVNITLMEGETIGLFGDSGSGKIHIRANAFGSAETYLRQGYSSEKMS